MRLSTRLFISLIALFGLLILLTATVGVEMAQAFSSSPPNSKTGAPGEASCTQCHGTFPLDSGAGSFDETCNTTGQYVPGDTVTICIDLLDPDAMRWGFEITIIDADGEQAGVLSPLDAETQTSSAMVGANMRQYGKHTSAGTSPGTPVGKSWTMQWITPPEGTGAVTLYGMGNAANNNGGNSGDRIYSLVLPLEEATGTGAQGAPLFAELRPNFPNPFNPKTTLSFSLAEEISVALRIYDSKGRLVSTLRQGPMAAGEHQVVWNGRDGQGHPSPSGVYFARLQDATGRDLDESRKLTLLQ